jgi:multidrug resistance efflux pump|tara:strand:- start:4134 stop:5459 length:1326 start_codon:yes stop_codon:yes gene_type:complete
MTKTNIDKKGFGFIEERSDQVREILGKAPNWMIRSGSLLIFFIILLLILGSAVISYNEVIPGRIMITTNNPPINLKAKISGLLKKVNVEPNEDVVKGQVLAEIQNEADFEDVIYLESALRNDYNNIPTIDSLEYYFPLNLKLGEIQPVYLSFLSAYQNLISSRIENSKGYMKSLFINNQLIRLNEELKARTKQLSDIEEELIKLKNKLKNNKIPLSKKNIKPIKNRKTSTEYFELQKQQDVCLESIAHIQTAIINYEKILKNSEAPKAKILENSKKELEYVKNRLAVVIDKWRQDYLIVSPVNGSAVIFDIWSPYQNITIGETIFTVLPKNNKNIIGIVNLPIKKSGKAKIGQEVFIKLDNYPFEEWGSLRGKIENISKVPKHGEQSFYSLHISLEGLKTSLDKTIPFNPEMHGNIEIIVEELNLLQRIFYQLRIVNSSSS